ncbi:MAG: glycosyltransferase family 2 protein [Proteobacteria bacterium]|nr:glycosyltransferase family 2 protein [Pseudomonadota bacterium]
MKPAPDICFLVPVYNHGEPITATLQRLEPYGLPCLLVDDGSEPGCARILEQAAEQYAWVDLIRRPANSGKGAALKAGFTALKKRGYTHAFQIDADGQHDTSGVEVFLNLAARNPQALILGVPIYDHSVSRTRYYGRYLSHVWVWINSLSLGIRDCMCGFRIYPLDQTMQVLDHYHLGDRMEFDIEILVHMAWQDVLMINQKVAVGYPEDGTSHFRLVKDNVRISWAHTRLFFGMLRRLPRLLKRRLNRRSMARVSYPEDQAG